MCKPKENKDILSFKLEPGRAIVSKRERGNYFSPETLTILKVKIRRAIDIFLGLDEKPSPYELIGPYNFFKDPPALIGVEIKRIGGGSIEREQIEAALQSLEIQEGLRLVV